MTLPPCSVSSKISIDARLQAHPRFGAIPDAVSLDRVGTASQHLYLPYVKHITNNTATQEPPYVFYDLTWSHFFRPQFLQIRPWRGIERRVPLVRQKIVQTFIRTTVHEDFYFGNRALRIRSDFSARRDGLPVH